jgi:phosphatidylglycerol:prolipoprotein diacylglycerol transferase
MSMYGLILGLCTVIGIDYFRKRNTVVQKNEVEWFLIYIIAACVVGARLYHVFHYWDYYLHKPIEIIYTWNGGLGIFGALIGGLSAGWIFCYIRKICFWNLVKENITIVPLLQAIGRLGNFFNKEVYGNGGQPVWLYESILCMILFAIMAKTRKYKISIYLCGYGLIRLFTEYFRNDTWTVDGIRIGTLVSFLFIIMAYEWRNK